MARRRLLSHFHMAGWAEEQITGIDYLFFLRRLITEVENNWSSIAQTLNTMRDLLIQRQTMLLNVVVNAANRETVCSKLETFLSQIPNEPVKWAAWMPQYPATNEGLAIPARVNYVGMGVPLYAGGYKLHGSLLVIHHYLASTWLMEQIRIKGGAYAAMTSFDIPSGIFSYTSYRDPNLTGTLAVYEASGDFLRRLALTDAELTKAIISAIGLMDTYQLPDTRGYESLKHDLIGLSDDYRQQLRDEVLSTTRQDFSAVGETLSDLNDTVQIVVVGSSEVLAEAGFIRNNLWAIQSIL
jgi:Zn-dependent M16 (insulinase) family peptidase